MCRFDKHKVKSQVGVLAAAIPISELESEVLPISICDWRTKASNRVVVATFAAECSAALEGYGVGHYLRSLFCEVMYGHSNTSVCDYSEAQMKLCLFTDCMSLYDHVKAEGSIPDDRQTAVYVAALKCSVSAGPGRDESKAQMRWVPTAWQLADGLTKAGLADKLRQYMSQGFTKIHEESVQQIARVKKEILKRNGVNFGRKFGKAYSSDITGDGPSAWTVESFTAALIASTRHMHHRRCRRSLALYRNMRAVGLKCGQRLMRSIQSPCQRRAFKGRRLM